MAGWSRRLSLEALEPELFFRLAPGSAERLAGIVRGRLPGV